MGDHSWRTATVWRSSAHWTAEEQAASHGGAFDPRPAYLLKLPGQQTPATVTASFDAVRTRALLDQLMAGALTSPEQLQRWVQGTTSVPAARASH